MNAAYQPGDVVFSIGEIRNDGTLPDLDEDALVAADGARGVVINEGHLEDLPDKTLYLAF